MVNIKELKPGNTVRHVESGNAYTVTSVTEAGRVFAVREIEISNPDEWILVEPSSEQKPIHHRSMLVRWIGRIWGQK